ncbi:solute symporter family protein, partial [Vibrio parahaemolyticus V-223/04]
CTTSTQSY